MKAYLLYRDHDAETHEAPWNAQTLTQDLALDTLLDAMAGGDAFVRTVATRTLLAGWEHEPDQILYRQAALRDVLAHPAVVRELYALTVEVIENRRAGYLRIWGRAPSSVLFGAVELLQMHLSSLRRLRDVANAHATAFASEAFSRLFAMLERELTDAYLGELASRLTELRFRDGMLLSAELGPGNAGRNHRLHRPRDADRHWFMRLLGKDPPGLTFRIADRDQAGAQILSDLRNRGSNLVANALAQSVEHVEGFFHALRAELAFYVGCLTLHERLSALGAPTCFPRPRPTRPLRWQTRGLYDPCLALQMQRAVVGNDVTADDADLILVTGANQGGKSVFLRAVGIAQLMLQSGMFVAADAFDASVCPALATHYKREEDPAFARGKFAEELARLSEIVDHLVPGTLLLFNESFAATNEREGSEVARQIVSALRERDMRIVFVSHLYAFARNVFTHAARRATFLRAERLADGTRTFRLTPGAPAATSHGRDLYERIFAGA